MGSAEVLAIPEGSLLVLHDVELDEASADSLIAGLTDKLGHDRFVVLTLFSGSAVEVWGPDDDLTAKVQALLNGDSMEPNALTGVPGGAEQYEAPRSTPQLDDPPAKHRIPVTGTEDDDPFGSEAKDQRERQEGQADA